MSEALEDRSRHVPRGLLRALVAGVALCQVACANAVPPRGSAFEEAPPHVRGRVVERSSGGARPAPASESLPAGEMSLPALLSWADRHSPLLLVARATRSRADSARAAASVLQPANPEVSFAAGPRFGLTGTGVDVEAGISQQLQVAGERGLRLAAASRLGELTDAEIEQMRWAVHAEVHALFHRALVEAERVRLAEQVAEFQRDVLGVVERNAQAGETAPLNARLARAELAQAEQSLVAARQSRNVALLRLVLVAGWSPDAPPSLRGELDAPRDPPPSEDLEASAARFTPLLRQRVAAVREAQSRVDLADREAWPRPTVGVQYRREGNPTSEGAYDIVMGALTVPLSGFQRNQAERARARADRAVAEADLAAAQVQLRVQLAEARSEMAAAAQRTRAYGAEILPRFAENLALLRRSFEVGEIDILALLVGRERFLRIQSDALAAQLDYFVAMAALERLVGVDLWQDEHSEGTPR